MLQRLADWYHTIRMEPLDWIQVEISSHCNGACLYCPHTVCRDSWRRGLLPLETYKKLLPAFRETHLVYLQGWGEPLMHDSFFKMVRLAKDTGARVGTTTNGSMITDEMIDEIVSSGLDIITFSLAGIGENNDAVRGGSSFARIVEIITKLNEIKQHRGSVTPAVHIAYLMLQSNRDDIRQLPSVLDGMGTDQIVVSTLDFVPSESLRHEILFPRNDDEYQTASAILDQVAEDAARRGIAFYYHLGNKSRRQTYCTENVGKACFVSSDGSVSPCVFTNVPVFDDDAVHLCDDDEYTRLSFGNINDSPLPTIWQGDEYRRFRKSFEADSMPEFCRRCPKLYMT